jgi:hypothetical protein
MYNIVISKQHKHTTQEDTMSDTTTTNVTIDEIVTTLVAEVFGQDTTISPYKIAKVINKVFEATMTSKQIPAQMMYNYASKGMIAKGNKGKEYTKDEVTTYVLKYTSKHVEL